MSKASRSWPAQFLRSLPPPVFCMPMCGAWFVQTPGCMLTRRRAPVCFTFRRTLLDGRPLLCRRAYAVWMWEQTRLRRPPGQPPPPIGPVQAPVPVPQPVVPIPLALPAAPASAAALAVAGAPPAALVAPPSGGPLPLWRLPLPAAGQAGRQPSPPPSCAPMFWDGDSSAVRPLRMGRRAAEQFAIEAPPRCVCADGGRRSPARRCRPRPTASRACTTPARACVVALLPLPPGALGRAAAAQRPSRRVPRAARRGASPPAQAVAQAVGGGLAGGGWRTGRAAFAWNSCAYRSAHNAVRPSRAGRGASRQPVEGFSVRASVCDGRRARLAHSLLRKHAFRVCRSGFAVLVPRQCDCLAGLCGVNDGQ
jgi:hypothetical protein